MNKIRLVAIVVGAGLCAAPSFAQVLAPAQLNAPWTRSCSLALAERVRQERPGVTKVETLSDTLQEWMESPTQNGVQGDGQFLKASDWVRFQFRCVYNTSSRRVDHLSHSVKAAAGTAGPVHSRANADAFTSKTCSAEAARRVLHDRPRANIQMYGDSFESWQASEVETGVSGRGEAQGPDGGRERFKFECLCDVRSRRVTQADVQWVR
jgi:hypothetical protein